MAAITNKRTKRLLLIWLSIFVVICCILVAFRNSDHSTVYKGKTIDQWLEMATKDDTHNEAIQNLNEAGELALPDLVRALTKRESFFFKNVAPRLPSLLKRFVPQDKCWIHRDSAEVVILTTPLGLERIVPALRTSIPVCDEEGLFAIVGIIDLLAQGDVVGLNEVAKVIPELRRTLSRLNDPYGRIEGRIRWIETLIQADANIRTWVPLGTSFDDARRIMENHQFDCSLGTNEWSKSLKPGTYLEFIPRGAYGPNSTSQIHGVYFELIENGNQASSVCVKLRKIVE